MRKNLTKVLPLMFNKSSMLPCRISFFLITLEVGRGEGYETIISEPWNALDLDN